MTRSQFILGVALLVVAGTLAFTVSFRKQEREDQGRIADALEARKNRTSKVSKARESREERVLRVSQRTADRTRYEVSTSKFDDQELAEKVQRESLDQLEEMTTRYQLTGTQRRQIFPLIAKHHSGFQDSMTINGQRVVSPAAGGQLASEIYPLLDPTQQDLYQDFILSKDQWWAAIITQLRDDLAGAIESGEMIAVDERGNEIPNIPIIDEAPSEGHGTALENKGGGLNLESLIEQ